MKLLLKNLWFYALLLICSMTKYVSYTEEEVLELARENHHLIFQERQVSPQIMRLQLPVTAEIKLHPAFQSYPEASLTEGANKLAAVYSGLTQKPRAQLKFINDFNINILTPRTQSDFYTSVLLQFSLVLLRRRSSRYQKHYESFLRKRNIQSLHLPLSFAGIL